MFIHQHKNPLFEITAFMKVVGPSFVNAGLLIFEDFAIIAFNWCKDSIKITFSLSLRSSYLDFVWYSDNLKSFSFLLKHRNLKFISHKTSHKHACP